MKISKLFHWLYAILMLLPVFYFLFGCINVIHNSGYTTAQDMLNVFSSSLSSISSLGFFSWVSNSLPYTAIEYIFGIFNCQYATIIMLVTYWLDISICWLVFDLIMYLPLLAHRWLDKAKME